MWRYLAVVTFCIGIAFVCVSHFKQESVPAPIQTNANSPAGLLPSNPDEMLEKTFSQNLNKASPASTPPGASRSKEAFLADPESPSAAATKFIDAVDLCAQKLGLTEATPEGKAAWVQPANQEALKECMARVGVISRSIQEDKKRDLEELGACVYRQTGTTLPGPREWAKLPKKVKDAILSCRNVLKGWVIQSQLKRLLEPEK